MAGDSYRILCRIFIGIISIIAVAAAVTAFTVVILASHLTRLTCHVTYASLEFNFTSHNTINYEVAFTIAVHNPNKYYNIEHHEVSVMIYYKGQRYGSVDLNSFHQRTKSTADLTPSFKGQIGVDEFFKLNFSGNAGTYGVVAVKVRLRNEYSFSIAEFVRKKKVETNFTCELKTPTLSYINRQSANISVSMPTHCN